MKKCSKKCLGLWLFFFSLNLFYCEKNTTDSPSPPFQWQTSTPSEQGLIEAQLTTAANSARGLGYVHSLLVIRNGYLVSENYFNGKNETNYYDVKSVSKSFISALVGLALEHGFLTSLDQKMMDFFPKYSHAGLDPRKYEITIRHLLSMRSGLDNSIEDYDNEFSKWINSADWIEYAIEYPMTDAPGERFAYITACSHLLSAILTKATGMSTLKFANRYLFSPLQITIRQWDRDPQGYYFGGSQMYFTPRDMAVFGYCYLHNGFIHNSQIVSKEWVEQSLADHVQSNRSWGALDNYGYGYQWWLGEIKGIDCFLALGYGGQFIIVFPDLQLIIVATSDWYYYSEAADEHERAILDIVANNILEAVENNKQ